MPAPPAAALLVACACACVCVLVSATPPRGAGAEVDLLGAMSLHNTTSAGVSSAGPDRGPEPLRPAYSLQGNFRELRVPPVPFSTAVDLLRRSPEFTLLVTLRQDQANSGSIVSFSHGYNRYLELQSSGRRNEIRLHYVAAGSESVRVESFPYRLADGAWHRVALSVSGTQAQLLVDCHPLYRRSMPPPDRNFTRPQLALWLGQRNIDHSLFKGDLQDVRLVAGPHGYLAQCPGLDSECPTCGQFSLLQATVQELTAHIQDVSKKLMVYEQKFKSLEACDCHKSCVVNGTIKTDGSVWQIDCNRCSCLHGVTSCRPVECTAPKCKNPAVLPGACCPTCLKGCFTNEMEYEHGEIMSLNQCVLCECKDGSMECKKVDPKIVCPPLTCGPSEQFSASGECCKYCPGVDYCGMGNNCHGNATCLNLNTKYACTCDKGFDGDGVTCRDIDECSNEGGRTGHHCHSNTRCTNSMGSYECTCLAGYARLDRFNCVEIDECATGDHLCSPFARCLNTPGSYSCRCERGFVGDGVTCEPVCSRGCLNGGTCRAPEVCECRPGFTGQHCERDLDECATDTHHCPPAANCVNMPGWYYCKCKPGYRSVFVGETRSTTCRDIDECEEGLHTCHRSARCVNTPGSFRCNCSLRGEQECRLSCMDNNREVKDGERWLNVCQRCECVRGVLSCSGVECDCPSDRSVASSPSDDRPPPSCCPQCDPANDCRHQELHHIVFRNGEKWVYQCQTCECLKGEIDCWELECPVGDVSIGERACCSSGVRVSDVHAVEALCSPDSPTPCPQAAHRTAPDCQMAYCATLECGDGLCDGMVGGGGLEANTTGDPSQASGSEKVVATLEPG